MAERCGCGPPSNVWPTPRPWRGARPWTRPLVHDFPSFWSDLRETLDDAGGWWPEGFGEVVA
jgi:hypothetical protein